MTQQTFLTKPLPSPKRQHLVGHCWTIAMLTKRKCSEPPWLGLIFPKRNKEGRVSIELNYLGQQQDNIYQSHCGDKKVDYESVQNHLGWINFPKRCIEGQKTTKVRQCLSNMNNCCNIERSDLESA